MEHYGRQTILFWPDVYKEQGHWLPTLKWAEDMLKSGHTVNYMGIIDCEGVVNAFPIAINGAVTSFPYSRIFENTYPQGYTTESHTSPNERWRPDHIWAIAYSALGTDLAKYKDKLNKDLYEDALRFYQTMTNVNPDFTLTAVFLKHKLRKVRAKK